MLPQCPEYLKCTISKVQFPLLILLTSAEICLHRTVWSTEGNTGFKQTEEYIFFKLPVNVEERY